MNKATLAIYDDIVVARQVVEDLVNADFARSSISLITNDAQNRYSHYLDKDYAPRDDAVTSGEGAGFGAVVGTLTGILVGIAALTIPGIGLAIAAGPIVAGLTGALAGAVTGGIVGALVKSGVPEDEAPYYAEGIRRGGTLISLETADTLHAEDIMHRYGSINIHERSSLWRQTGWQGFDTDENEDRVGLQPVKTTTQTAIIETIPATPDTSSVTVIPVVRLVDEEPQIDNEDTVETLAVVPTIAPTDAIPPAFPLPNTMIADVSRLVVEKGPQPETEDSAKYNYQLLD